MQIKIVVLNLMVIVSLNLSYLPLPQFPKSPFQKGLQFA